MKGERKKRGRGREATQTGGPEKASEERRGLGGWWDPGWSEREGGGGREQQSSTEEQGAGAALPAGSQCLTQGGWSVHGCWIVWKVVWCYGLDGSYVIP